MPQSTNTVWVNGLLWIASFCISCAWAAQPVQLQQSQTDRWQLISSVLGEAQAVRWGARAPRAWVERGELTWRLFEGHTIIEWSVEAPDQADQSIRWSMELELEDQLRSVDFVWTPSVQVIGPVPVGTTAWRIATRWQRLFGPNAPAIEELIEQLVTINPQAFGRPEPSALLAGAMLSLPIDNAAPDTQQIAADHSPVPWQALGTSAWLESTMAQAIRVGQHARQRAAYQNTSLESGSPPSSSVPADLWSRVMDPNFTGPIWLKVFLVLIVLMTLHGYGRIGSGAGLLKKGALVSAHPRLDPEAVHVTLSLARAYLAHGDAAQALHWIEEVIEHGQGKARREAQQLWREAQAMFVGDSQR